MNIKQAFKFKLCPKPRQAQILRRTAGSRRFVFNKALQLQMLRLENGQAKLNYAGLCKELTAWKKEKQHGFLTQVPAQPLQQALLDLERAYTNFFARRADFPKFKKRGRGDSFRYPDAKQVRLDQLNKRVFLPKIGWVKYRKSKTTEGTIKQVTIRWNCDGWYMSVQTEREVETPVHPSGAMVGIDLGVKNLAALSDGTKFAPLNSFRGKQRKLAQAQRILARKIKHSANWKKQIVVIQKMHKKIADARKDYLHKTTTAISKNHAVVVIENLNVKGMSKSASGSVENPGTNVKAKSGLNRAILDQGLYEFRRQLEYKMKWRGGELVKVPAQYTSQRCSGCAWVEASNRRSQSEFECVACGHKEHADVNAAKNILAAGRAVKACGELSVDGSMKQEPSLSAPVLVA